MIYVALLRGINVGGKSAVAMPKLKDAFERLGFQDVRTYINSGNVVFSSSRKSADQLTHDVEAELKRTFKFEIAVLVRNKAEIQKLLKGIPGSWVNNSAMRCNVIFLWSEIDSRSVLKKLPINPDIEEIKYVPGAAVWRIDVKNASRSRMNRISGMDFYKQLTIRNVNTVRKLADLMS